MWVINPQKGLTVDIFTTLAIYSVIETERLYLRPFTFADADSFYELASNPDNLDFIFPMQASRGESDYLFVHAFLKNPLGVWALEDKVTGQMIGAIKFDKLDFSKKWAELGYFVKKEFQGRGFATEALKIISFLCFQEFGLKKLCLVIHEENKASQKVAEKAGFKLKRRYKGSDRYTHKVRSYLEFEMTRSSSNSSKSGKE